MDQRKNRAQHCDRTVHPRAGGVTPDPRRDAERPPDFPHDRFNKPFTAAGFGNWFRYRCDAAGLPHCTFHGLRKAAARRLAEYGCTPHEIAAITGHATLKEIERYTKAASRKRLAASAMAKVKLRTGSD